MTDQIDVSPPTLRLVADLNVGVYGQLQELAVKMNANRNSALHEAIVLANLLYAEAAKRGKVVVKQRGIQKVIVLPKVPPKIAESYGVPKDQLGLVTRKGRAARRIWPALRQLFSRKDSSSASADKAESRLLTVQLTANLQVDVAGHLQDLAVKMNANRNTALHEAIVLANLLYSEAGEGGTVVVKQKGIDKVISLPRVPPEIAAKFISSHQQEYRSAGAIDILLKSFHEIKNSVFGRRKSSQSRSKGTEKRTT